MDTAIRSSAATTYGLCGFVLDSELPFPELAPRAAAPDVVLRLAKLCWQRPPGLREADWFSMQGPQEVRLHWEGVASARLSRGRSIELEPHAGAAEEVVRAAVLGPVLSVLLAQRGLLPLHASLLRVRQRVLACVARSGGGKSTLAAAMRESGHELLADDVAALRVDRAAVLAYPGFPQLRLSSDVLRRLGRDPGLLRPVFPGHEKLAWHLGGGFPSEGVSLGGILLLEEGERESIEPMAPREALLSLIEQVRVPRMLQAVLTPAGLMARCARLVERVPVHRLRRPLDLQRLPLLVRTLEAHAAG